MGCCFETVIKKQFVSENKIHYDEECDQCVFSMSSNTEPRSLNIGAKCTKCNSQVSFFNTDGEVYFDKIKLDNDASFSSIVRNYWWNGKEGKDRREGYYSLIKSVKELEIKDKHINDLVDYVEDKYDAGEHWQLHELNRNIELKINNWLEKLEIITVERLQKYFDDIYYNKILDDLKTVNNIVYNCWWYKFKNCKEIVPEKLIINATVEHICFNDAVNEVRIPEIMMEEKANLKSVIQNYYGYNKYILLLHVQTLIIRNNPKVLCDLADYINGRHIINYGWKLHELDGNMKIVVERPGIAFCAVKKISGYFTNVLVDNNKHEQYLARQQQQYEKQFQKHFSKYDLKTEQIKYSIIVNQELRLIWSLNITSSNRKINKLYTNRKIELKQFICFHDTDKPVVVDKIVIEGYGNLRCVLQNAYYNGTDSGFFSLLRTAKELKIRNDHVGQNQVLIDLANYIEGKYTMNANWKPEELDKDMRIRIYSGRYSLALSVTRILGENFRNVSIDHMWTPLGTENTIDQECKGIYISTDSKETTPQKLVINGKLMDGQSLILFDDTGGQVHTPKIAFDEQGYLASIIYNGWLDYKYGQEYKYGLYSRVQHVKTLTIMNNPGVLKGFADYVAGKYEIGCSKWQLQQLRNDIKVVVESPVDSFLYVLRVAMYFQSVTIDENQVNDYIQIIEQEELKNPDYKAFITCFEVHGLLVKPLQYGVEFQKELQLVDYVYNIRKSMDSIYSLTVRQKLNINQFVCFHDIDKPVTVDKIIIEQNGDLRSVLQNAYYNNGQGGFFSLLQTCKILEIHSNEQAVGDLANYVDGKYVLYPKWRIQTLDKDMVIKIQHNNIEFYLDIVRRLKNYLQNVFIYTIKIPLEIENIIDQNCEDRYVFTNSRDVCPQKLLLDAKLASQRDLILFKNADGKVYIPEITIGKHGSFDAIVRDKWWNCKNGNERKWGYYSLISHVKTLIIQNNPEAVRDLDSYVSGSYKIQRYYWEVQKLSKNILIRINGVKGLDEQINRLKDYFGYIFVDDRKSLRNSRQQMLTHINSKDNDIRQKQAQNKRKQQNIDNSVTSIQDAKPRIERARARLRRRHVRFQKYLALIE